MLLSVLSSPTYVAWARQWVGPTVPLTAFVLAAVADDERAARDAVRGAVGFFLRAESHTALVGQSRHGAEIREIAGLAAGEPLAVEDAWIDEFAVAGNPDQVGARLTALIAAGAGAIGLWLFPPGRLHHQLRQLAGEVLPTLG